VLGAAQNHCDVTTMKLKNGAVYLCHSLREAKETIMGHYQILKHVEPSLLV
jgi:hypothetical protein